MINLYYKLDGKTPVECTLMEYAEWMQENPDKRIVKQTTLPDGTKISTVFLGLNHAWGDGPPILFETMVFGGEHDQFQERYETWGQAEEGHKKAIELTFS